MSISQDRIDYRNSQFKKGITSEDARRKRENKALSLRKAKREDKLNKRRNHIKQEISPSVSPISNHTKYIEMVYSSDPETALKGIRHFRGMSSAENKAPLETIYKTGIVSKLVEYLTYVNYPKHQYEAAWLITNLISGPSEIAKPIIEKTEIGPYMAVLLGSSDKNVRNQAAWCLANIAGESVDYRNVLLKNNVLERVLHLLQQSLSCSKRVIDDIRLLSWVMSNMFTGTPSVRSSLGIKALPVIKSCLQYTNDEEVIQNVAWTIARITLSIPDTEMDVVFKMGVINRDFIELLSMKPNISVPTLRTFGNIIAGTNENCQRVLDLGFLNYLPIFIQPNRSMTTKEAIWVLSNMAAGDFSQRELLMTSNILPHALKFGNQTSACRKESCYLIFNMISMGTYEQLDYAVRYGLQFMASCLSGCVDKVIINLILKTVKTLLKRTNKTTMYVTYLNLVEETMLDNIERLQNHDDEEIYDLSVSIIEKHYHPDEFEDECFDDLLP